MDNSLDNKNTSTKPENMEKIGEHLMTDGEVALFAEVHNSFDRLRTLIAMYMGEKHGYSEKEPVAFEFNWQNRIATVYRPLTAPASKIEVTNDTPTAPAPSKTA